MGVLAVFLYLSNVLAAQNPSTEQDWRAEIGKARNQQSSAKLSKWASIAVAGAGGALIFVGALHDQFCLQGPGTGASSFAGHPLCDQYAYRTDWKILGPGIGLAATGVVFTTIFSNREARATARINELLSIGKQRNWTVSFRPTAVNIAFSW